MSLIFFLNSTILRHIIDISTFIVDMKKFVDIENLRVVWDEINKRFVRLKDISDQLYLLENDVLESSMDVQLRPEGAWDINVDYYNLFIEFINSNNIKKYVLDIDGNFWNVISKAFYDQITQKFTGCILSSNTNDGDVYFWYMRVYDNEGFYTLEWYKYIGELPSGNFVSLNTFNDEIGYLKTIVTDLSNRISLLEQFHNISNNTSVPDITPGATGKRGRVTLHMRTTNNAKLNGAYVNSISSVTSVGNNNYGKYNGDVRDIAEWYVNEDQIEFLISYPYAIEVEIKRTGYEKYTVKIAHDSASTMVIKMISSGTSSPGTEIPTGTPDNTNTPTPTPLN